MTAGLDAVGRGRSHGWSTPDQRPNPRALRRPDGRIDVARIAAVAPALTSAAAIMDQTTKSISAPPRHTWLSSIDAACANALRQVTTRDDTMKSADLAVRILPPMHGADSPKRHVLAFQNEAKPRGTGTLPGAFAILDADRGKLTSTRIESDTTLSGTSANVSVGPDYRQLYDGAGTPTYTATPT